MNTVNDVETGGDAHVPNEVLPYSDVVMKGGITSGVVYPLAVIGLSKKYRLKNVGAACPISPQAGCGLDSSDHRAAAHQASAGTARPTRCTTPENRAPSSRRQVVGRRLLANRRARDRPEAAITAGPSSPA